MSMNQIFCKVKSECLNDRLMHCLNAHQPNKLTMLCIVYLLMAGN